MTSRCAAGTATADLAKIATAAMRDMVKCMMMNGRMQGRGWGRSWGFGERVVRLLSRSACMTVACHGRCHNLPQELRPVHVHHSASRSQSLLWVLRSSSMAVRIFYTCGSRHVGQASCQGCVSTLCELEAEVIHDIRTRPAEPQGQSKVREELGGSPDLIGRTIIERYRCMNV
jgi:hypothetical protein